MYDICKVEIEEMTDEKPTPIKPTIISANSKKNPKITSYYMNEEGIYFVADTIIEYVPHDKPEDRIAIENNIWTFGQNSDSL